MAGWKSVRLAAPCSSVPAAGRDARRGGRGSSGIRWRRCRRRCRGCR